VRIRLDNDPGARVADVRVLLLLTVVVLAGVGLRFYGLDAQSLWNDELSSWERSNQPSLAAVIEKGVRHDPHPPGYQIMLYGVERFLGDSETLLRLPSALAGVFAIVAMFFLGNRLYSPREGLIAATLVAFSYQPIYYSQEARAYSLLLLFAILSAHFWFRIFQRLEARRSQEFGALLGYAVCAIVSTYLHYFGLLLVAVQLGGLVVLGATRPRQLGWVAGLGAVVVAAYVPWLPYLFEEFGRQGIHIEEPGLHSLFSYWRFLFYNPGDHLMWFVAAVFAIATVRSLASRDQGSPRWWVRARPSSKTLLLVAWLVVPFAIAYIRSKLSLPVITNRNLIISLPAAFLLFSHALTRTVETVRLQALSVLAMVGILLFGLFVSGGYYRLPRKEQFREAALVVVEREAEFPDARIIAHAWSKGKFDYYLERLGAESRVDLKAGMAADVERVRAYLAAENPEHVWFLLGHMQPEVPFIEFLDHELELVAHFPFYGAFVRLYRRR